MRSAHLASLVGCCAAALVFVQCGQHQPAPATAERPLRIGIDLWAGYYPLVLAQDLGFLAEEGVAVEITIPKDTDRMLANFAAGDYDAVCVSIGDVITLTRNMRDVRLVLLSDESAGGDQVLCAQPLQDAAQLRGKRIGTNLGGFGELFVRRMLASRGVAPDEVQWVDLDAAEVPQRLAAGEIDFGHTWEPYASQAIAAGMHRCYSSADTPGLILDGLIARGQAIAHRGPQLRAMIKAWLRAVEWWEAHPAEGDRRIEKRLSLQPGEARPSGIRILDVDDNRALMLGDGAPPQLEVAAEQFVDFFVSRGLLLQPPKPRSLFDPTLLP